MKLSPGSVLAERYRLVRPLGQGGMGEVWEATRGIVHRDLKPANVFLSRSGESEPVVKVLDFGIAKWLVLDAGESALRTQTGHSGRLLTWRPSRPSEIGWSITEWTFWSLGVIFYECLSGARPVEGENAAHMVMRLLSTGIIPIGQLVPTLPRDLAEPIGRMLSREPAQRPQDLREVCAALAPLTNVSVPTFGEPRVQPVSPPSESAKSTERSAPPVSWQAKTPFVAVDHRGAVGERARPDRTRTRRRSGPWVLLAAGTAVGGVALGTAQWLHAPKPAPAPTLAARAAAREAPGAAPDAPAETRAPEQTVAANLQPSPTATASVSLRARPDAPRWVPPGKQPSGRGAPMSTAAAPTLEPTKPGRAPPNPLDIELQ